MDKKQEIDKSETGLSVVIKDGQLVISMGVETLAQVTDFREMGDAKVISPLMFAESMTRALLDEEEDGTTKVHRLFDSAGEWCLDQGEPGILSGDEMDRRNDFERNCSCHISPPCGNCIEHSELFPEEY